MTITTQIVQNIICAVCCYCLFFIRFLIYNIFALFFFRYLTLFFAPVRILYFTYTYLLTQLFLLYYNQFKYLYINTQILVQTTLTSFTIALIVVLNLPICIQTCQSKFWLLFGFAKVYNNFVLQVTSKGLFLV